MRQLSLFEESLDQKFERELNNLKGQYEKMRKTFFAKHSELMKLCLDQKHELDTLRTALCHNSILKDETYEKYKISAINFVA